MNKLSQEKIKRGDFIIIGLTALLVVFGTVMIFSASYYASISENDGDPYSYLRNQLIFVVIGTELMWLCSKLDYHLWGKFYLVFLLAGLVLLLCIFTPLAISANGATRWLGVPGIPFTIMPGECAKFAAIVFTAGYLDRNPKIAENFVRGVMPVLAVAGVYFLLIMKQPNMSTAMTLCIIVGGMLLISGAKWSHLGTLVGIGAAGAVVLVFSDTSGYRYQRMLSFLDPFEDALGNGWQVVQGLLALGTGGLTGRGLGNSIQKNLYLPEPMNDFILAIIGEELGFLGILALMTVYLIFVWRGCHIAMNAPDFLGMMLAGGITIMVGVQVAINVAVVTSTMPPTGIVLPFISYGGNALMIFMASVGILLNISKKSSL
ncbi:MAG: putative lipid II flippase FtsW [Firmicutes bacterium]|nr:putative lipid II flippase FtsW [Bacillota bacterium]